MSFEMDVQLAGLLRLVREQRLTEAQEVLATIIGQAPEVTAQWLVLVRLLLSDASRWNEELQQALGQLGAAPLGAYRQAVKVLERVAGQATPPSAESCDALEAWLVALEGYRGADAAKAWRRQEAWLHQVRARQAEVRLTAPGRVVARLEALAGQCRQGRTRSGWAAERVISRLDGLCQAMVR